MGEGRFDDEEVVGVTFGDRHLIGCPGLESRPADDYACFGLPMFPTRSLKRVLSRFFFIESDIEPTMFHLLDCEQRPSLAILSD